MSELIEVDNLQKEFVGKKALDALSFTIKKGETFGFLGPSGSGKTTTIKILTAQLTYSSGKVHVFGQSAKQLKAPGQMKRIGVLTDNTGLYDRLTIYDNLKLYCDLYDLPYSRINEVLEEVGLSGEERKQVSKMSKGMKQRATLARTILHKPELLFLDEPTSSLDPVSTERIHRVLRKLNEEGTTIFLTTHDMHEAERMCDRLAFLNKGRIQIEGTPQELRLNYTDSSITIFLKNGREYLLGHDPESAQLIAEAITSGQLVSIHSNEPTLGEVFARVTGKGLLR
ncbi:ABC-2 type transport system ATP-binding protein [Halobacillus karajensis]|uniref:Fluoroquinolones export ATP-binding proteinc/MT2762 n=1 Tax=Halobacillus karajensis TaxID=195088 RepID=A0A024P895_9BACI|nr:ABC transporter ATP-binding protein [Halobacillus karajensis]CDQ21253.1 Fluoroquinolones export ATP-binding proteinc/MT2762 [Halobacillus karajensis]CDQ25329.1 Fluoroquinolones export ATP-binding proteinc/MT2762 [Halobacillus karajensis]CDQ25948.1 Fluoroquinolones export ATP-binding proteinc/MT2762 [Halobacillus karajensis]SEI10083.1 ABC-2 type transport system ATP-binding protein [Halobacillus karajensis]